MQGRRVGHRDRWRPLGWGDEVDPHPARGGARTGLRRVGQLVGARGAAGHGDLAGRQVGVDLERPDRAHLGAQPQHGIRLARVGAGDVVAERLDLEGLADDAAHGIRLGAWRHEPAVGRADDLGGDRALGRAAAAVGDEVGDLLLADLLGGEQGDPALAVDDAALGGGARGEDVALGVAPVGEHRHREALAGDHRVGRLGQLRPALPQPGRAVDRVGDDPHGHLGLALGLHLAVVDPVAEGERPAGGGVGHADVDGLTVARDGRLDPLHRGAGDVGLVDREHRPGHVGVVVEHVQLARAARPHGQLVGLGLRRLVEAGLVDEVLVLLLLVVVGAGRRHQGVPVVDLGGLVVEVPHAAVVEVVEHDQAAVDPEGDAVAGLLGALRGQRRGGLVAGAAAVGAVEHPAGLGPRRVQAAAEHHGAGDQRAAGNPVDPLLHGDAPG